MENFTALADLYNKSRTNELAFSALPDAPVLPYAATPRRLLSAWCRVSSAVRWVRISVAPADLRAMAHSQSPRQQLGEATLSPCLG